MSGGMSHIDTFDPKPGAAFAADDVPLVVPDIIVDRLGSGWAVSLNKGALPTVEIDRRYSGLLAECDEKAEGMEAFRKQLGTAKWIIHAIQRRQETLLKVGSALVQYQADFLEGGREALKPLLQKDIAKQLKISESTVSRIVNAMYIQTPTTVLPLRAFFCAGIHAEIGQKVMSSAQIQGRIRSMVAAENPANPLSDGRIAEALHRDGIPIARRTVAKYRELARIPSRALRRKRP